VKFADVPNGLAAMGKVPVEGWLQWVALCGAYELVVNQPVDPNEPGNYGKGRLGIGNMVYGITGPKIEDAAARTRGLNSELANGRLAMMAITGMMINDGLTGQAWGEWAAASSAFESELGVQAPVGFWDPLGFAASGDAASFRRRRAVELKHGRVSMLACMGYIVPEYNHFPGYLSPSLGLKFSDVPAGLAAFTKVPASGWAQMITFAGTVELFQYTDDPTRAPGDFKNAGLLGIPNGFVTVPADQKAKKLSAEIANGRLAMMAIMGMFFQDGLTGSAWGDWALYTDSPLRSGTALRAAKDVLAGTGGPFPENYWDPAGISKNKTEQEILELRAIELKHGRTAMLAVLGWFHVAAGWHFIGDFAVGERVSDNPLVNVTQLPMGGAWQVVFTIMCFEWLTTYVCKPPAEKPWDIFGWSDIIADEEEPEWKKHQLQELNNGRLAMVAFVGLVVGDVMFGDYGAGLGQVCGGGGAGDVCAAWLGDTAAPMYEYPALYPRGN
jgi:light-harvesting complex I chlorophyll a/b binding protein 1